MRDEQLRNQLALYADYLDEVSMARTPDHTSEQAKTEGEVIVVMLDEKATQKTDAGGQAHGGGARAGWLLAVAAAVMLVAGLAFLLSRGEDGSLDTTEEPDVELSPDIPEDDGGVEESAEDSIRTVGERLEEATALESNELLSGIYSPEVQVRVDGFDFETGAGFDFVTDTSMAGLIDTRFNDCVESEAGAGVTAVDCDWSLDFSLLEGTAPAQVGMVVMDVADGKVTRLELVSENIGEVASGLSLYRGWVESFYESDNALFTPIGTLALGPTVVQDHEEAAAAFLADTDVAADLANVGSLLTATLRAGDLPTTREVFTESALWTEPEFSLVGDELFGLLLGADIFVEVALWQIEDCTSDGGELTCPFVIDYSLIPGLANQLGEVSIGMDGERVSSFAVNFSEPSRSEHLDSIESYRTWIQENYESEIPGVTAEMFFTPTLLASTEQAVEYHTTLGQEWSETLEQ